MNSENPQVGQFDALFLSIAQYHPHGPLQLLDTFVDFLSRKADFFVGDKQDDWENLVLQTFRKYEKISLNAENAQPAAREAKPDAAKAVQSATITELTNEEAEKLQQEIDAENNEAKVVPVVETCVVEPTPKNAIEMYKSEVTKPQRISAKHEIQEACNSNQTNDCDKLADGKLMPNKGNGCDLEKYSWTQSLSELEITVPLNITFRARQKDVVVKFTKKHITVGLKNQTPIIDDKFQHDIKLEESTWIIEDGKTIMLSLDKVNKENWWSKIVASDPEISLVKINPEPLKLSHLKGDLHAKMERMMYDERQRKMGLPSSEEQQMQETLKKFIKQHPGQLPDYNGLF